MVLSTPISQNAVKTDNAVAQFVDQANRNPPTEEQLQSAKILYQQKLLLKCFDYQSLATGLRRLSRQLSDNYGLVEFSDSETLSTMEKRAHDEIFTVSEKFKRQLQSLFNPEIAAQDDPVIQERVQKASRYFSDKLQAVLIHWLSTFRFDTDNKEVKKQITKAFEQLQHDLAIETAALKSCRAGFSTHTYLSSIAHAEIDFRPHAPSKQPAEQVNASDLEHPELYQVLKTWRAKQAREEDVEHYRILHQRVLIKIARMLPDTVEALRSIKGVGKSTAEKYGEPLTAIVRDYCHKHNIDPRQLPPSSAVDEEAEKDSKQKSYELFLQGKDIKQIAEHRGLATSTVEGHLAHYVGQGLVDVSALVAEDRIDVIKKAFDETGQQGLKAVKEHLGDEYSYSEIRFVQQSLN
jgi:hypothetical protein